MRDWRGCLPVQRGPAPTRWRGGDASLGTHDAAERRAFGLVTATTWAGTGARTAGSPGIAAAGNPTYDDGAPAELATVRTWIQNGAPNN